MIWHSISTRRTQRALTSSPIKWINSRIQVVVRNSYKLINCALVSFLTFLENPPHFFGLFIIADMFLTNKPAKKLVYEQTEKRRLNYILRWQGFQPWCHCGLGRARLANFQRCIGLLTIAIDVLPNALVCTNKITILNFRQSCINCRKLDPVSYLIFSHKIAMCTLDNSLVMFQILK